MSFSKIPGGGAFRPLGQDAVAKAFTEGGKKVLSVLEQYKLWLDKAADPDNREELLSVKDDDEGINDRFFKSLAFGTGGLRGVIGAGTNRMNIYTVGLATQALAVWVQNNGGGSVAIGYDSRIKSDVFARETAAVLAANGIEAHIYKELEPTPCVSYAIRKLGCKAGVMVTASHNPSKYNGYKCYGPDGYQMTDDDAHEVERIMKTLDIFNDVKHGDFDKLLAEGKIKYIPDEVLDSFIECVYSVSVHPEVFREAGLKVVYTPLCGTGNKPVRRILAKAGVTDVTVVTEQELPNGSFPRCPYPNPEIRQAFDAALELAGKLQPELLLATDPDCDRVGIAVRDRDGSYKLMTGNEVGAIMLNYLLSERKALGTLPEKPLAVKTIVTSYIAERIAREYDCELRSVLTGFKYIGEIVTDLEKKGETDRFIMGYEESYGYLVGSHARDKDAVVASMMICEMASFYKLKGKNLLEVMDELYSAYGYYINSLKSSEYDGEEGMKKIASIMEKLRGSVPESIAGSGITRTRDYLLSEEKILSTGGINKLTLPKSNVFEYILADGCSVIARPSGTEPKIKYYLTAVGDSKTAAEARVKELSDAVDELVK